MTSNLRRVFFTWNNWAEDFESRDDVKPYFEQLPHLTGAVIGFETGAEGTDHLQGVLQFSQQKTWKTLQGYLKKNHMEAVRSMAASVKYCKGIKEDHPEEGDYFLIGEIKIEKQRTDIMEFKTAILQGESKLDLFDKFPHLILQYNNAADSMRQAVAAADASSRRRDVSAFYLAGESGVGKTTVVYDTFGYSDVFRVTSYDHPFDGYNGQSVLFLDEFRGGMSGASLSYSVILNLLDGWPMELTARRYNNWALFDTVVMSSNWEFSDQYSQHFANYSNDRPAFRRRFDHVEWATKKSWKKVSKIFDDWAESRKSVVRDTDG